MYQDREFLRLIGYGRMLSLLVEKLSNASVTIQEGLPPNGDANVSACEDRYVMVACEYQWG